MSGLPNFVDTTSIQVFCQIAGAETERIWADCLYTIDEPNEVREIVALLKPVELSGATQRKATNWLIFRFRDHSQMNTDLDQEAGELRVTSGKSIREFRITDEACRRLGLHIERARLLYEDVHGR
jgi:signal transduction histidine kinase